MNRFAPRPVVKCDKFTMQVIEEFPTVSDAERAHGKVSGCISHICKERQVGRDPWVWRYKDDYDPDESFEGKSNRPVIVLDTKTKEAMFFNTQIAAAKALYISESAMWSAIRNRHITGGRYLAKYAR